MNQEVEEGTYTITLETRDMLQDVFATHEAFRGRLGAAKPDLVRRGEHDLLLLEKWTKEFGLCMIMESAELIDWTRWKHWSQQIGNKTATAVGSDQHLKEMRIEIADLFCFLINLATLHGMNAVDLYSEYHEKMGTNHARQDLGTY